MITDIVDTYAGDGPWDLDVARREGVLALLHKATEGMTYADPVFAHAMRCASTTGMLRGAYHFGRASETGEAQAERFLSIVEPLGDDIVMALDLEGALDDPRTMTTAQAQGFVTKLRALTGRWPVLYAGASKLRARMARLEERDREVFRQCPLWLAAYGERPRTPAPWSAWSLWQYTDGRGAFGPRDQTSFPRFTGGFHRCDRSAFDGTAEALTAWWTSCGR